MMPRWLLVSLFLLIPCAAMAQSIGGGSGISNVGNLLPLTTSPLGINLGPGPVFGENSSEMPFLNMWKLGSGWVTRTNGGSITGTAEEYCLSLDANGDLTTLSPSGVGGCSSAAYVWVTNRIFSNLGGLFYPAGVYDVFYTGTGSITYGGDAVCTSGCTGGIGGSTGHDQITVTTPSNSGIQITITATSGGGNYLRGFSVTNAGTCSPSPSTCTALYQSGEVYHPLFVSFLSKFCQLRFMDWMNINFSNVTNYTDIVPETYAFWGSQGQGPWTGVATLVNGNPVVTVTNTTFGIHVGTAITGTGIPNGDFITAINTGAGTITLNAAPTISQSNVTLSGPTTALLNQGVVPVSLIYKLANKTGADVWVNIPANATEAFATSFATTLKNGFNANQKVYLEYTNEPWNGGTLIQTFMSNQGNNYFAFSFTGALTSGNPVVPISSVVNLFTWNFATIGVTVSGNCIPANDFIIAGGVNQGGMTVTLNAAPTCNGSFTISGPAGNNFNTAFQYYGVWAPKMCADFKAVLGSRVICVLGNQTGTIGGFAQQAVTCTWAMGGTNGCLHNYDAITISWYNFVLVPPSFTSDGDGGVARSYNEALLGGQISPVTMSVPLTSGSKSITVPASTGLVTGMLVTSTGSGIPANTRIDINAANLGINYSTNVVTLTNAATANDTESLTFTANPDSSSFSDTGVNGPWARIESDLAYMVANSWNLLVAGYEGSWYQNANTTSAALNTLYTAINSSSLAQQTVAAAINKWVSLGLGPLNYYADVNDLQFGAVDNILQYDPTNPSAASGKYAALYSRGTSFRCH